jgi:hypothetical protein
MKTFVFPNSIFLPIWPYSIKDNGPSRGKKYELLIQKCERKKSGKKIVKKQKVECKLIDRSTVKNALYKKHRHPSKLLKQCAVFCRGKYEVLLRTNEAFHGLAL